MRNTSENGSEDVKQFARYLYEYRIDQRIRNTGFVRVETKRTETVVHIHGQGFRLMDGISMELFLFWKEEETFFAIKQGRIDRVNPSIHYRLSYTVQDVDSEETYAKICGIMLRTSDERYFIATWNDQTVNVGKIQLRTNFEEKYAETFTEVITREVMEEEHATEHYAENEEEVICIDKDDAEECRCECENDVTADEIEAYEKHSDCDVYENKKEFVKTNEQTSDLKYRKITRQEIAGLPRCEWRLANNSFLLHGYYNYHHLVLIERGNRLLLGVPGIYHRQEEKAAELFGFTEFVQLEEMSEDEKFGYWCRRVRRKVHESVTEAGEKGI